MYVCAGPTSGPACIHLIYSSAVIILKKYYNYYINDDHILIAGFLLIFFCFFNFLRHDIKSQQNVIKSVKLVNKKFKYPTIILIQWLRQFMNLNKKNFKNEKK